MKKTTPFLLLALMSCPFAYAELTAPVSKVDVNVNDAGTQETTQFGAKINNTDSLTAGDRGAALLEDFMLREKIFHFDHERIPERVVHARGVGVHGYFQSYQDWSNITAASFLRDPSAKTPVFVRFSTVLGSRGSPDTVRDVRGFATRFYTNEGLWDLDAIKFPDLIHAGKGEPDKEVPQAGTAHNTAYDFFSQHTETIHTVLWAISGRGTPRSLRQVEGFGVHTYRLINEDRKAVFVKFHWKPVQGLSNLVWDEASKIAGKDIDYHRNDLYTAIEKGDYPEFELGVQIVPEEDEHKFDFDLLDSTKIIPEDLVPVKMLGKMTLNRNPANYFAETEQVTFHPGHIVRGITFTNDPLLQGRLFSYTDTQINRMSSANYMQLPINRPLNPVHNNQRDGFMQTQIHHGSVAYYPNALQKNTPAMVDGQDGGYLEYPEKVGGRKQRGKHGKYADHFTQAQLFYHSLTTPEQQQVVDNFRFELGKCLSKTVRQNMVDILNKVDNNLARRVARGIAIEEPSTGAESRNQTAPGLSIHNAKRPNHIKTKKVAILTGPGIDADDVRSMQSYLEGEGAYVDLIGPSLGTDLNITQTYTTAPSVLFDAVYVPSGENKTFERLTSPQPEYPFDEPSVFLLDAFRHGKPIAASGQGVQLLKAAKVPLDKEGVYVDQDKAEFKKGLIIQRFWSRMPIDHDAKPSATKEHIQFESS
ncbi:catalase-like domain-containing protein [Sporodiniella umbellata]|nr:catalase-like domain-containing protein [Sporodiniella umbellata]